MLAGESSHSRTVMGRKWEKKRGASSFKGLKNNLLGKDTEGMLELEGGEEWKEKEKGELMS